MKQSKLATALLLALSIFGMALVGAPNAHAEDDDDDDEVIEEVVVTAYRWPTIMFSSAGAISYATYAAPSSGEVRTTLLDQYDLLREALKDVCLPAEVKIVGGVVAATYACNQVLPNIPGKDRISTAAKAGCVAYALLKLDDIPEC